MTRFAVIANCQARPLSTVLGLMRPDWLHIGDVIVHLSKPAHTDKDHAIIDRADLVLAQLVQEDYPAGHLATSRLKERYGERVVTWPNLFFQGQTPDTFYLTAKGKGRIPGPLHEYHSLTIYQHWRDGLSPESCLQAFGYEGAGDADEIARRAERSLQQLAVRERCADVAIADFVAARWRKVPLFHVFNHPNSATIIELAKRLLAVIGIAADAVPTPAVLGEPLGNFVPPMPAWQAAALGLDYPTSSIARGRGLEFGEDSTISSRGARIWPLVEFVEASYRCYDLRRADMEDLRITPRLE